MQIIEETQGNNNTLSISNYFQKVFFTMFMGLLVTFLVGYILSTNNDFIIAVFENSGLLFLFAIIEIALVMMISAAMSKFSKTTLYVLFYIYAAVNALTFSAIFIAFEISDVIYAFGITALLFAGLAGYGYVTKKDISKMGNILFVGLIMVIIATVINLFMKSSMFTMILSLAILIIFILHTIYDVNKLKKIYLDNSDNTELLDKIAVYGALTLYLDFINMFYQILYYINKSR